jgi:hypothetical protein
LLANADPELVPVYEETEQEASIWWKEKCRKESTGICKTGTAALEAKETLPDFQRQRRNACETLNSATPSR